MAEGLRDPHQQFRLNKAIRLQMGECSAKTLDCFQREDPGTQIIGF